MMLGLVAVMLGLTAILLSVRKADGLVRRLAPKGARRIRVDVLGRASVGPKQGIAVVRVGPQVMIVSVGDGGVRKLGELDGVRLEEPPRPGLADGSTRRRVGPLTLLAVSGLLAVGMVAPEAALAATTPGVTTTPVMVAYGQEADEVIRDALAGQVDAAAAEQEPGPISPEELDRLAERLGITQSTDDASLRIDGPVGVVLFMGLMAILPTLVLLMTSFTRILVVLHFVRQALGTQTAPPGHLLAALALLLTTFVMGPTFNVVHQTALTPWMDGEIEQAEMLSRAQLPFRDFMLEQTRETDLVRFVEISDPLVPPASADEVSLPVLLSAFVTSELRTAFQIGFAMFLPFVIIDVVVASVLMSMGMFMLPPVMVSLPIKLLLFVLVDGWGLLVEGLVTSF